jgi:hypothetical protein
MYPQSLQKHNHLNNISQLSIIFHTSLFHLERRGEERLLNCLFLFMKTHFFVNISRTTFTTHFWHFNLVFRWWLKLWLSTKHSTSETFTCWLDYWVLGGERAAANCLKTLKALINSCPTNYSTSLLSITGEWISSAKGCWLASHRGEGEVHPSSQ